MKRREFFSWLSAGVAIGVAALIQRAKPQRLPDIPESVMSRRKLTLLCPDGSKIPIRMKELNVGDKFTIRGEPQLDLPCPDIQNFVWTATGEPYQYENGNWGIEATGDEVTAKT